MRRGGQTTDGCSGGADHVRFIARVCQQACQDQSPGMAWAYVKEEWVGRNGMGVQGLTHLLRNEALVPRGCAHAASWNEALVLKTLLLLSLKTQPN